MRIAHHLRTQSENRDLPVPALPSGNTAGMDASALASATADMNDRQPNLLQELFAPGGTFSSPLAKAALLGITAFAAQRISNRVGRARSRSRTSGVVDASAANPDNLTRN